MQFNSVIIQKKKKLNILLKPNIMRGSIKIPSDMSNTYRAENFVDKIAEDLNIGDEMYGNISVCIVEAVSNAIQHGNESDVTKIVTLEYIYENKVLEFVVKDEGEGFIMESVPDPTLPENIENFKGRGIFLITHLSDKVEFNNNGSKVTLKFNVNK